MEMSGEKIFKGGLAVVALLVLAFFVHKNWDFWSGRVIDYNVSMVGPSVRPGKPGEENKKLLEYLFATGQERMTLEETDIDGQLTAMTFKWDLNPRQMNDSGTQVNAAPEAARAVNPLDKLISDISDARRRYWLKNTLFNTKRDTVAGSFVVLAGLDKDQKAAELELRQALGSKLTLLDDDAKDGSANLMAFKQIRAAVEAARGNSNAPDKDPKKAAQIKAVIQAAKDYEEKIDLKRIDIAQNYVDAVQKLLNDKQAAHVDEFIKKLMNAEQAAATQAAAARRPPGT